MNEEFDKLKTKVVKYVMYKKRTEREILQKFSVEDEELLKEVIEYLKEADYINDNEYIEKIVKEFIALKALSIKELEYKLLSKGLSKELVKEYIYENREKLLEYEMQSAERIVNKKSSSETEEIREYLSRKGYMKEVIKVILEEI